MIATHKCRSTTPAETDDRPALHRQSELIGARLQRGPTCRLRLGLKMTYTQRGPGSTAAARSRPGEPANGSGFLGTEGDSRDTCDCERRATIVPGSDGSIRLAA